MLLYTSERTQIRTYAYSISVSSIEKLSQLS